VVKAQSASVEVFITCILFLLIW